ncbi:MAG TPA: beta-propeller domain-containing protein, partial [Polyangiaceae bacterium]|nr:beta-propeller domain-containing protein [Polyangiaceae bacterium]
IDQELQQWRDRVAGEIGTTTLDNWIPRRFERIDGRLVALPLECESYFVPEPGLVQDGVTQVVTFDIEQPAQAPHALAVLGGAGTVYANLDTMVLGQTDYGWNYHEVQSTRTLLHRFSLAEAETNYEASGFVPGYLHNQFSIDEAEGVIRVSTTEDRVTDPLSWSTTTENRVYTLGADGRDLEVLGKTDAFGEPGETIFATRFLGDRGYVVTFRQTDPLVAVDLSDAAHPKVLGELHIPGFSDYIHPLPNHHLLTIGQDADENGSQSGVALQIFDVTDAAAPRQVHKETFGGFSYSEASYNHKAFSFVDGHFGEGRGLLMFPITTYDPEYSSRLEVLEVSASAGFTRIGSIDHTKLLHDGCGSLLQNGAGVEYCYYGGNDMRRGLEIGQSDGADFVYAISYGGITVHDLADLSTTLKTVPLPAPTYTDYYSYGAPEVDPAPDAGAGGSAP